MKKYISLFVLIIAGFVLKGQGIRNSLLGLYGGTYQDYALWPAPPVPAGVKITALPTDTSGMIVIDTINSIVDTIQIALGYSMPHMIPDTVISYEQIICGDVIPACDTIYYSRFNNPLDNPIGIFKLKCTKYYFPTSIKIVSKSNIAIYPNPTKDKLYISSEKDIFKTYSIYTVYGQVVDSGIYSTTIEVRSLPVGMYYLKLSGKTEAVKSFIKN